MNGGRLSVHLGSTAHAPPAISSRDLAVYAVKQVQLPKGGGGWTGIKTEAW